MKHTKLYLLSLASMTLAQWGQAAWAADQPSASGLEEVSDAELGGMRGRYTAGDNTVAWFGVQMISTWQTEAGQSLESTLALTMDFRDANADLPKVTFEPTVTITQAAAAVVATTSDHSTRSVDASGLANVSGMQQSVQIAGNDNAASNVTHLHVQDVDDSSTPADAPSLASTPSAQARQLTAQAARQTVTTELDGATATASFDDNSARVLLSIAGQGQVQQWIRNGSVGQSVQLTSDNQLVSNRMEISLVRQAVANNTQLAQNVAQAIHLARNIGLR